MSKIQTDISLSTLNSEYVTFYHSGRYLIPLKIVINKVVEKLVMDSEKMTFVSISNVYEENNVAIFVVTSPRMTPSSKHIFVKCHWFRHNVGKEFVIRNIESENQKSDISTKGLQGGFFVRVNNFLFG